MIIESPLYGFVSVEALIDATWTPLTGDVQSVSIQRGGQRNGPVSTVEPGTLHCTLVNRTDLIDGELLKPNQPIRVRVLLDAESGTLTPIWTGRINDINTRTVLDKATSRETDHINVSAVDAVTALTSTTRYGAVTDGGAGFETWALRIARLNTSAPTSVTVEDPADDSPIVRYVL